MVASDQMGDMNVFTGQMMNTAARPPVVQDAQAVVMLGTCIVRLTAALLLKVTQHLNTY